MDNYHLKSMTAYGRGSASFPYGRFTIEIQSVNRRFLEINIGLPRLFIRFESDIRKSLSENIGRGMLNITMSWKPEGNQPVTVVPNIALAKALKEAWEKIGQELQIKEQPPLSLFAYEKDLFLYEEEITNEEVYRKAILDALTAALHGLIAMKREEGNILAKDLNERLNVLETLVVDIESRASGSSEKYRLKLQDKLEALFSGNSENEERILREVAIYAERVDITEEIVRFKGHLEQFESLLNSPLSHELETRGKTLDFLVQELLRETNTIGSKASDLAIAQHVVTIKSELERIREQVQNIE